MDIVERELMKKYQMSDMGDVALVLGMWATRDGEHGTLDLTNKEYTKSILARFGVEQC